MMPVDEKTDLAMLVRKAVCLVLWALPAAAIVAVLALPGIFSVTMVWP